MNTADTSSLLRAMQPLHPTLYRLADDGRSLDFLFAQCKACNGLTFPANAPGCMQCGDPLDDAGQVVLAGGGTLLACVTLHVALVPGMAVPSTVGDIRIAAGIVEEGVIDADEARLQPGMAMQAVAVATPAGDTFSCRFVPATGSAGAAVPATAGALA